MKSALVVLVGMPVVALLACSSGTKDTGADDTAALGESGDSASDTSSDSASPTGDTGDTSDTGAPPDTSDTGGDDTSDTGVPDSGDSGTTDTSDTGAVDTADTGTPDTGAVDLCVDLPGSRWSSVEELECGRAPGGVALCHWQVQFGADGTFDWRYSDVAEVGEWACTAGVLTASTWGRGSMTVTLVDATHLTWVDVPYVRD